MNFWENRYKEFLEEHFWEDLTVKLIKKGTAFVREVNSLKGEYQGMSDSQLIWIFNISRKNSVEWFAAGCLLGERNISFTNSNKRRFF